MRDEDWGPDHLEKMWKNGGPWMDDSPIHRYSRPDHDITRADMDREAELDRWLGHLILVFMVFGVWKVLELGYALARWLLS